MPEQTFEIDDFASVVEAPDRPRTGMPARCPLPEAGLAVLHEPRPMSHAVGNVLLVHFLGGLAITAARCLA